MQAGPRIPVGVQLETAEVGPTAGPTWRLSHLRLHAPAFVAERFCAEVRRQPAAAAVDPALHDLVDDHCRQQRSLRRVGRHAVHEEPSRGL